MHFVPFLQAQNFSIGRSLRVKFPHCRRVFDLLPILICFFHSINSCRVLLIYQMLRLLCCDRVLALLEATDRAEKDSVQRQQCCEAAGGTGLAGAAAHCLSHLLLPFTSAFD